MKILPNSFFAILCFCLLSFTGVDAQKLKIGIVTLGKINPGHLTIVEKSLEKFYYAEVVNTKIQLPLDSSVLSISTPQARLEAAKYLPNIADNALEAQLTNEKLAGLGLTEYDYIIGITDSAFTIGDLNSSAFIKLYPQLYLMRGVAAVDSKVATVSTYKLKKEAKDESDFKTALVLVARHEMAHLLRVGHCKNETCLMGDALKFSTANKDFCQTFLEKMDNKYLRKRNL